MKLMTIVACLVGFNACMAKDKTYVLDGVPVVREFGDGPERAHLALAVGLYRDAAVERFVLDDDAELQVWRSLREIRYTPGAVDGQALYRFDQQTLYSNWYNCALDVPLYAALTDHYVIEALGDPGFEDPSHWEWAEELQDENEYQVCSGVEKKREWRVPVPW